MKKSYKNNKFKVSAPPWNKKLELPDGSALDIQDYFYYIIKKHVPITDNLPIIIYVNQIKNIRPEAMKLFGSTKSKITKDKNGENVPLLDINEVVLDHCNVANNYYQQDSRVFYTFVPHKPFGQLLDISPKNLIFLETFYSEFSYNEVWFTDQNSKPLEI